MILILQVGSANTNSLQVFGPSIQPRHCLISLHEGVCTVTPLHADAITFVNGHHITQPTILHVSVHFISASLFLYNTSKELGTKRKFVQRWKFQKILLNTRIY